MVSDDRQLVGPGRIVGGVASGGSIQLLEADHEPAHCVAVPHQPANAPKERLVIAVQGRWRIAPVLGLNADPALLPVGEDPVQDLVNAGVEHVLDSNLGAGHSENDDRPPAVGSQQAERPLDVDVLYLLPS